MKRCISGQATKSSEGSAPKTCAVCSVRRKNPATPRKPRVTIPPGDRHQDCSFGSVIAGSLGSARPAAEEVVQPAEQQGDIPAPQDALDKAKEEAPPAQEREAWQEDSERFVG